MSFYLLIKLKFNIRISFGKDTEINQNYNFLNCLDQCSVYLRVIGSYYQYLPFSLKSFLVVAALLKTFSIIYN